MKRAVRPSQPMDFHIYPDQGHGIVLHGKLGLQ